MNNKLLTLLLVSSMTVSLLAGCAGQTAAPEASDQTAAAPAAEAGKSEESAEPAVEAADTQTDAAAETDVQAQAGTAEADAAAEAVDTAQIDFTTGTPWICSSADGVVTADTVANVKDDFYLAVNKDDLISLEIPEGYSYSGTIISVARQNNEMIKNLFTSGEAGDDHDAQLALNLYSLFMDWDSRNAAGMTPLKAEVDAVEAIDTMEGLLTYWKETPNKDVLYYPYSVYPMGSLENSNTHILTVDYSGLLLEDSAEYTTLTDYGRTRKEANRTLATKLLVKMGYSEAEAAAKFENCLAFEAALAPTVMTMEEQQQPDFISKINNHYTRDQLIEAQGKLPIIDKIENIDGYPQADDYLVFMPAWLAKLNELFTDDNLTMIKDFLIVHGSISCADVLDRECYEWSNDCKNAINGSSGILPDETVFAGRVKSALAWPVSKLYCETYLEQEDKDRVQKLIEDVIEEYHGIIEEADFLSDETKAAAIEKLDAMGINALWPDNWDLYSYEGLEIASAQDGGTLWNALNDIGEFENTKLVKDYSEPVNKEKWSEPPTTVNCCYEPTSNSIFILGAFAQGDLYNTEMSDEEMFATIGAVIGHEISHAFDSSGAQFDKDGNMASWWTEEDYAAFRAKNKKLEEYYSAIQPWEGVHCKGSIVTGEACADMGGIKCMLRIAAQKENFDYDKFFRTYAHLWLNKATYNRLLKVLNDVHPFEYLRTNTVLQQFDAFLECYDLKEGDGMYLAPEDRVNIW